MPADNGKQFHHMLGDGLLPPPGYDDHADMTDGNDVIHGGNSPDIVYAYDGNDRVTGNNGPDQLYGMNGNDKLHGGSGPDILDGGDGNDVLHGGLGGDSFTGGEGADKFMYKSLDVSTDAEPDTIEDFQSGIDHIVLKHDYAGVTPADIHITDDGAGGSIVTVDGFDLTIHSRTPVAIGDFTF
jgi:Ca2+-binding RTX toxin-like protein